MSCNCKYLSTQSARLLLRILVATKCTFAQLTGKASRAVGWIKVLQLFSICGTTHREGQQSCGLDQGVTTILHLWHNSPGRPAGLWVGSGCYNYSPCMVHLTGTARRVLGLIKVFQLLPLMAQLSGKASEARSSR